MFEVRLVFDSATADSEQLIWLHQGRVPGQLVGEKLNVQKKSLLDRSALRSASVQKQPVTGASEILITLTEEGSKRLVQAKRRKSCQVEWCR